MRILSLLNERIMGLLGAHRDASGRYDCHAVVNDVKPTLTEEEKDQILTSALYEKAKALSTRNAMPPVTKRTEHQLVMFPDLEPGYVLDLEGSYTKNSIDLTESEMKRIIEIRSDQITADKQSLALLKAAYKAARPIWAKHPDWTLGQVDDELARRRKE